MNIKIKRFQGYEKMTTRKFQKEQLDGEEDV